MAESTDDLAELLRALQSRVPLDAAALLAGEPPERIEAALHALPKGIAMRIAANLPGMALAEESDTLAESLPGEVRELMDEPRGALPAGTTVEQAIAWLRAQTAVNEITYLYVTDAAEKLIGMVVMRDLLLAASSATLAELMLRNPFTLSADDGVGEAVKAAIKRHYPVYPVVDAEGRLVGLVRGWKLFERQAVEIVAQSGRMVGVNKAERIDSSLWSAFRQRHPWLQLNLLTAFVAAWVVGSFADTITRIVTLAAFLPVLAGQSGNNGCQALAITLRGITLGDIEGYPIRKLLRKEVLLGGLNGVLTGLVAGAAMWWSAGGSSNPEALKLGLVILLAMTGACMASGLFGVMVPLILRRFGADPATASSIFLTTGTDIAGMGMMLVLATALIL